MATDMEVMPRDAPEDPDAQATITDFLDYTEYLPSDLARSLTLIGKLDEGYLAAAGTVHDLAKEYGSLPSIPPNKRPSSQALRYEISQNLDYAISSRESASGEASRLYEMVDRHYNRLTSIRTKLHALPKPPSRDPTPVPRSPQATRRTSPPRITLRLDGARPAASAGRVSGQPKRYRSRKITVPGEVLPPPNPDSPGPFTDSDWESIPPSPIPMPTSRVGGSRKPGRNRPPKKEKVPKQKVPKAPRPPRQPGAMGTNVHSAVAGISTSNALSLLSPPPADAKPGSVHAPWMRLTEWEMAKLRKRMKKNAIWTPSETMIRRELSIAGRGPENYRSTKRKADEEGVEFVDDDNIATTAPGKPLAPGEISADSLGLADNTMHNRGMKLNEMKKQKREQQIREQAATLASEANKLDDLGSSLKELFTKPNGEASRSPALSISLPKSKDVQKEKTVRKEKPKEVAKTPAKKRKRDETPKPEAPPKPEVPHKPELSLKPEPPPKPDPPPKQPEVEIPPVKPAPNTSKKRKTDHPRPAPLNITTQTVTTTVPLAAPAPSPSKPSRRSTPAEPATPVMAAPEKPKVTTTPKATATSSRPRRVSLTLKGPSEPPPEPVQPTPRTSSRNTSRRGSTGPPSATTLLEQSRHKTVTPAPTSPAPPVTAAGRRSKRPAPGVVVDNQDGGAAVSVGKRQHAPRKRAGVAAANVRRAAENASAKEKENAVKAEEEAAGEEIDPNEPRYCLCGDVSWGEMVACENGNCEREWFHFDCVGLKEKPGRREKWYCPDCRGKFGKK